MANITSRNGGRSGHDVPPESRIEREAGMLHTGEMGAKRFSEHVGVVHGTIKRWLTEGLPARRNGNRVWITPEDGEAWIASRYPTTIARDRRGLVYFAVRASDGAVKIGWTSDVMRRVAELRKAAYSAVELAACFPGDKPDELRLHERFRSARLDGEWHRATSDLLAFVDGLRKLSA